MEIKWANPSPFLRAIPITLALIVFPMTAHAQESSGLRQQPSNHLPTIYWTCWPTWGRQRPQARKAIKVSDRSRTSSRAHLPTPLLDRHLRPQKEYRSRQPRKLRASELDTIPVPQSSDVPEESRAPPQGRQLEEIVVTAQKREQVSQDVPISMFVISDVFIQEKGITDVKDAHCCLFRISKSSNLPTSLHPNAAALPSTRPTPHSSSPCGFAFDGVAFARAAYFPPRAYST